MSNIIQADPAKLRAIAEDIRKVHASLRTTLEGSAGQVGSLQGVWTGGAADAFAISFKKIHGSCQESLETVARMATVLYDSADAYEHNEAAVKQEASKLPKLPQNPMR